MAAHLEVLLREAEEQNLSLEKLPGWLKGWKSPWKGKLKSGELIIQGEDELYDLGIRTRARFPNLFNDDYHPDVYAVKATQVSFVLGFSFFPFWYIKALKYVFPIQDKLLPLSALFFRLLLTLNME